MTSQANVTVVVPTHNRVRMLRNCLEALRLQEMDSSLYEVVVVDDGSTDGTPDLLSDACSWKDAQIRSYRQTQQGPSAARNLGMREARGGLIAFTDDDCVPETSWLGSLVAAMPQDPQCAGIGGNIRGVGHSIISCYFDDCGALKHRVTDGAVTFLVTANALYRRQVLLDVGGFSRQITWPGGEDPELSQRICARGFRLAVTDGATVRHGHRETVNGLYNTFYNYGRGYYMLSMLAPGAFPPMPCAYVRHESLQGLRHLRRKSLGLRARVAFPLLDVIRAMANHRGYLFQKAEQSARPD
jgi:GT2 family glycosyltransferase